MARAILKKTRETRVRSGHPWVFASDVETVEGAFEPGDVVEVASSKGTYQGRAFYNPKSQIALRLLTRHDEEVDEAFFRRRVRDAIEYRRRFSDMDSCRLIFAESDFLPALVVDKFADVLALQSLCLGIEKWKDLIVRILAEEIGPRGIYERNDVPVRRLEGMEQVTGLLYGEVPDRVEMKENGAKVLDSFCHNGSFALNAAKYGAAEVLGVDISEEAVAVARENAQLNGLSAARFEAANCFDLLRELSEKKERFDLVVLDPPAFTKTRAALPSALRGYKEINLRGMKLTRDGGYLVTCSCSQHVTPPLFQEMLLDAQKDARVQLRQVEFRTQGRDHPILPAAPETQYLKCGIYQVFH